MTLQPNAVPTVHIAKGEHSTPAMRNAYRAGWGAWEYTKHSGLPLEVLEANYAAKYPNPDNWFAKGADDRAAGYGYYFNYSEGFAR